ncbi:MAG TPA: NAD-dependent DNA ligase LigA, partial [Planctomycetaceae bacterium]|nr:NAD-dependent DNA ligase LigA [Planctomycetaceae bacterium]
MSAAVKAEIERLRAEIERHNRLYFVEGRPEISDAEFDRLMKRLEQLEAGHPEYDSPDSPTNKVGGEPIEGFESVRHRVPMLSIENAFDEGEVREFDRRVRKLLGEKPVEYTVEYKVDGVALALTYEDGRFVRAVTRGNGFEGDDITANARTIGGVPLRLETTSPPRVLEVRGEAYITNSDFAHLQAEQQRRGVQVYANPRNTAAGALKRLDPKICAAHRLRFLAHGVGYLEDTSISTHLEFLHAVAKMGLPGTPRVKAFDTIDAALEYAHEMAEDVHSLD